MRNSALLKKKSIGMLLQPMGYPSVDVKHTSTAFSTKLRKGMAINMSIMMLVLVFMLAIMFLLSTVAKDFVFKQRGIFGLIPGTETLQLTDSDLAGKAVIECKRTSLYEYTVKITQLGLAYPSEATVYPVFIFKGMTATSIPEYVKLPGRLTFTSIPMKSSKPPAGKETLILSFFKKDDKCISMAKSGSTESSGTFLDKFIGDCAKSLETVTTLPLPVTGC